MKYRKFRQRYHILVSHEFGGVTLFEVNRKERAEKYAVTLEAIYNSDDISIASACHY